MTITRFFSCISSVLWLIVLITSIEQLNGQLAYSVHPSIFYSEEGGYLELYTGIQSKSLTFRNDSAVFEYVLQIENSNMTIVFLDKYGMTVSQDQKSTDYWDIQRIALSNGDYKLKMYMVDKYAMDTLEYDVKLEIQTPTNASLSKPILCTAIGSDEYLPFEKFGFRYEKLAYNLIIEEQDQLSFFQEYYQPDLQDNPQFFVKYSIVKNFYNPSMPEDPIMKGYQKLDQHKFGVYTKSFDVSSLLSGDYHLLTEYIDINQKVKAVNFQNFQVMRLQREFDQKMHADTRFDQSWVNDLDIDATTYALKSIAPRLNGQQTEVLSALLEANDLRKMRYFIYMHWTEASNNYSQEAYESYMKIAKAVDRTYGNSVGCGFENDRGFYFLKYGKPDIVITEDHEPDAPPYEIWIYHKLDLTGETDVRFLFYNPSLSENDFEILHSSSNFDVRNPDWRRSLYSQSSNGSNGDLYRGQVGDNFQRSAIHYFNNF